MSPALVILALLVSAHAAHGQGDPCKPDAARVKHDARILTSTSAQPKAVSPHGSTASDYAIFVHGSTIDLSYNTTDRGNCALGHVASRWIDTSIPLVLNLSGGNLASIRIHAVGGRFWASAVDVWGRSATTLLPAKGQLPSLGLWGDDGPLHAAVGLRWASEDSWSVMVGENGPRFIYVNLGSRWPLEWNVSQHRFTVTPGVWTR